MPKSFLVKNNLRVKSCPSGSDEEENVLTAAQDGWNIKSEETQFLWKRPHRKEINAESVAGNRTSSPSSLASSGMHDESLSESENINKTEVSQAATQPKLAKHEKLGLSKQNAICSSFKSEFVHHAAPANTQLQCDQCKKAYTTNSALVKHQRYYCNLYQKKSFTCKYCDKVYLSLGALKMHIRTHTLPCQCMICGKAFSRPWLLQGHIRTHTGEKPYECSNCCRAFADRSNLRAHLQTHSDVKKYKCERCTKTFSRMSLLLKHQNAGCSLIKV